MKKINPIKFALPGLVMILGIGMVVFFAPKTTYVNGYVGIGFIILCIGTFMMFGAIYKEFDRLDLQLPFPLSELFPSYPVVSDKNPLMKKLTGFRKAYGDFLNNPKNVENSDIQNYATQMLWHSLTLQKKRMQKHQLTLELESKRRAYTSTTQSVRQNPYFDGRYNVNDIYEEISSVRKFKQNNQVIHTIEDNEVAHYTMLSAKQVGKSKIVCPNCGAETSRENLIDGCDYCGTVFTVEDMQDRVGSFGYRKDFLVGDSKREIISELIYPWIFVIIEAPLFYFGLVGSFVYGDSNIFLELIVGIFAGGLLALLGYCLVKLCDLVIIPLLVTFSFMWKIVNKRVIYKSDKDVEQEKMMSETVRQYDPYFSIQSFFGNVQDKIYAVHYADNASQVNTISKQDLSGFVKYYSQVVDIDMKSIEMNNYTIMGNFQVADVLAKLTLRELQGSRIKDREEMVKLRLVKSKDCKSQAVCGASVLKCKGCGHSLSLLDGNYCAYCGNELDLAQFDWVISDYKVIG